MPRAHFLLILPIVAAFAAASAQQAPPQQSPAPATTLSTGTQLVVVDVTVQDRAGNPIHGLKLEDFMLSENKKPQAVKTFDEHTAAGLPAAGKTDLPKLPPMPPGTFTDFDPIPEDSTLNVLLLDALNTPMSDQTYVRYQLQQYVKNAHAGTRIAIFGLTQHLILLQGFSSDPEVLKNAVEKKLNARASVLLDDPTGSGNTPDSMSSIMSDSGASASAVAGVQQFEAMNASFQTQLRTTYTLEAFNDLAHYLAQFPGRKNLIWFSGSFPLTIFPDATLEDPFSVMSDASSQLKETTSLLDRARVAVYPIDARGLQGNPVFSAANSGRQFARNPGAMGAAISKFNEQNAQEHMTMDEIAADTGGRAFYNTNGLAAAVEKSINSGSNFYTLTYSPSDRKFNGDYRTIRVALQGPHSAQGLSLTYRRGYYAEDPNNRITAATSPIVSAAVTAAPPTASDSYARAAMMRGAPTPSEILFKARVLPATTTTEDTLAPHNEANPAAKLKPPYRRYVIDIAALNSAFVLKKGADGRYHDSVEFVTFVYDANGTLLVGQSATVPFSIEAEKARDALRASSNYREEISAPAKGESFLRIAIHDLNSGRFGVIEVPTSSVSKLPPPPPVAAAPATANPPVTTSPPTPPPAEPKP